MFHQPYIITVLPEILFGGWTLNHHCKNIGRFKFGGSVRDRHTYICKYETLVDFNLVVAKTDCQTIKFNSPPNFPAIRYNFYTSIIKQNARLCTVSICCYLIAALPPPSSNESA